MTPLTGPQLAAAAATLPANQREWFDQHCAYRGTSLADLEAGRPVAPTIVEELAGILATVKPPVSEDPGDVPAVVVDAFPDAVVVGATADAEPAFAPADADPEQVGDNRQHHQLRKECPSTIVGVKEWANTPSRIVAAIDLEERRKAPRSTLLAWLDQQLNSFDDPDQPIRQAITHLEAALVCLRHLGRTNAPTDE